MRSVSTRQLPRAIVDAATSGTNFVISWHQILAQIRFTWPRKTAEQLIAITGASRRTVFRWLAGTHKPNSVQTLAILSTLRDEHSARGRLLQQFELFAGDQQ